jgi:predicted Ser/Thr protein kinase
MSFTNYDVSGNDTAATPSDQSSPPTCCVDVRSVAQVTLPITIDHYEVLGELGRGAFGVVYRARDPQLNRAVAIKVLQVGPSASDDELARFHAEAQTLGSLQHPNIVGVYLTGQHRGMPYLVMELVEGGCLQDRMQGHPRQPREAAALVETLARAMHAAHLKGIVHRDLKPANILCTPDGTLKITDFGLAKRLDQSLGLSQTGQAIGTPSYMSPEQAEGKKEVGPAADVYALGSILYELLTGRPPFRGPDILAVLDQVRSADPLSPSRLVPKLPRDLCTICLKCLEKSPARRYSSALELADDLARYLEGNDIVARPAGAVERLGRVVRRRPWQTALVSAAVVVVVLAGVLSWVLFEHSRQKRLAELERRQEAQIHKKEEQLRQFSQEEYDRSLRALDGILELLLTGQLRNKSGLEPLYTELMGYYTKLIQRQGDSDLAPREKLADACLHLGQLIHKSGSLPGARDALLKAERLYQELARDPHSRSRARHHLAQTLLESGRVLDDMGGKSDDARRDYQKALALLGELARERPEEVQYQRDMGETLHGLAVLCSHQENNACEARDAGVQALKLRRQVCRRPGATAQDRRALARTQELCGDLLLRVGDRAGADDAYWESYRICKKLSEEGGEEADEARCELGRACARLAAFQTRARALATAAHFLDEALEVRRALVKKYPSRTEYLVDLADGCKDLAELVLLRSTGSDGKEGRQQALKLAQEAEDIYRQQGKSNEPAFAGRLAQCLALRGRVLLDDTPAEAKGVLVNALDLLRNLLRQHQTAEAHYQSAAVRSMLAEVCDPQYRDSVIKDALVQLEQACKRHFQRLPPDDIRQDRAFKVLRDRPELAKLLASCHGRRETTTEPTEHTEGKK